MSASILQQVPAGVYGLDPADSRFGFAVKHNGVATFRGEFEQVDASLEDGVLTGVAQVASVTTAIPQLKDHLLGADFFDASEAPTITFRSTDLRLGDDGSARADGDLTIRGVTRAVTARGSYETATRLDGSEVVDLDLEATIDRRDYGLNWQAPLPSGGDAVAWTVALQVHLKLARA